MSDAARRTVRTVLQTLLAVAAGLPLLVDASGVAQTLPGIGVALAVSGAITRVMALPLVDRLLPSWLQLDPAPADLPDATLAPPAGE
jgi:hypothetical protein